MELFAPVWKMIQGFGAILAMWWILAKLQARLNQKLQVNARAWPTAPGSIEWAAPEMFGDGKSGQWVGKLTYSYSVRGEYYSGSFKFPASNETNAWRSVEGWKGRGVMVRYSPVDPSKSVLVMAEQNRPDIATPDIGSN
jgi:hypothetical protein